MVMVLIMLDELWNTTLVRPGEYMVRLGSWSRKYMFNRLVESIEKRLAREGFNTKIIAYEPRIIIIDPKPSNKLFDILGHIFGISSFSPAIQLDFSPRKILDSIIEITSLIDIDSFAVRVIRGDAPISSRGLAKELSDKVAYRTGLRIDLDKPDIEIKVEIRRRKVYVYTEEIRGPGGLPYGVEGCLISLVSGGVDSAVASVLAMKRGVKIIPLFVDLYPYWGEKAIMRAYRSLELLYKWVPWYDMEAYIIRNASEPLLELKIPAGIRCIACKAIMYRYAFKLSQKIGCRGIVTGESIGQVASQTLNNISVLTMLSPIPVYRPVAFMDKLEIIELGRRMGFSELDVDVGKCHLRPSHPTISIGEKELVILSKELERIDHIITRVLDNNLEEIVFPKTSRGL